MMRILHVNLAKRGIGRYGLLYGRALAGLENVNALSVLDAALLDGPFLREEIAGVDHVAIEWSDRSKWHGLKQLNRIAAAFEPDIIHDSGGCYARSLPIWLTLRRFAPLVITEHDPAPHLGRSLSLPERATRFMMPRFMRHVFVHGPRCRESILDRGVPPENVSVIRHGHLGMFDRGAYAESIRREHDILFFGELRYNKGADLLPKIAERVLTQFPSARFIVAGALDDSKDDKPFGAQLRQALAEMKRGACFEVHDRFIPDEEVEWFFKRCAITVMPYREATQSGIAMIAMPLQSVVVATRVGDIPDVIHDGKTGYLADPTAEAIGMRIITVLENPDQTCHVRKAARKHALQECSWDAAANHITNRCETLVPWCIRETSAQ